LGTKRPPKEINLNVLFSGVKNVHVASLATCMDSQVCSQNFQVDRWTEISKWAGRSKKEEKKPEAPRRDFFHFCI